MENMIIIIEKLIKYNEEKYQKLANKAIDSYMFSFQLDEIEKDIKMYKKVIEILTNKQFYTIIINIPYREKGELKCLLII